MNKNPESHQPSNAEITKGTEWTLEDVASIGDLPENPTNTDLIEYGIRNGLLSQGEGIEQLLEKAQKLDQHSANILAAVIDSNQRNKKGEELVFVATMRSIFRGDGRRQARTPQEFLEYAQSSINDMMGAWVMTKDYDEESLRGGTLAYQEITCAIESEDQQAAKKLLSTLGDSGIRRILVRQLADPSESLESMRHTVYFIENMFETNTLKQIKDLSEGKKPRDLASCDSRRAMSVLDFEHPSGEPEPFTILPYSNL